MRNTLVLWKNRIWEQESVFAFLAAMAFSSLFVVVVLLARGDPLTLVVIPIITLLAIIVSSFRLSCIVLVVSLFLDFEFISLSTALWLTLPLGLSFVLRHANIVWKDFSTPISSSIAAYGLCILPSFLYVAKPIMSLFMLFNVVAFLIVLYTFVAGINSYRDTHWIVAVYLGMVFLNSIDVIILSISGKARPFGFAGVWFVDYSALGVCLALTMAFITRGLTRCILLVAATISTVALVLTQTRNTWISGLLTLIVLATYVFFHPDVVDLPRKKVVTSIIVGFILLASIVMTVLALNPSIEERVGQLANKSQMGFNQEGITENSVISRLLIWNTALNAFLAHPAVGIGVYAFRFSSHQYSKIPEILYYRYVAFRSPHQTELAVLTETGIIGFVGFSIFLITLLTQSFKTMRAAIDGLGRKYALVGIICVVYCTISMSFTDAWLWGQQIVLLGIVCGSIFAMSKLNRQHS